MKSLKQVAKEAEIALLKETFAKYPFESCRGFAKLLKTSKAKISRLAKEAGLEMKKVKDVSIDDYFKLTSNALGTGRRTGYRPGTTNYLRGRAPRRVPRITDANNDGGESGAAARSK